MRNTNHYRVALSALVALLSLVALNGQSPLQAADTPAKVKGQLTQESLGNLLKALNLKPTTEETRYDFAFKDNHEEAWTLSMSAVLSNDGDSIWIMAWLDELPSSAREVPRVALLRLLADNDKMGSGKFFSYIPANRRFVLQRVVPNRDITTKRFVALLKDLGKTVAETHGHWSVTAWTEKPQTSKTASAKQPKAKTAAATSRKKSTSNKATPASGTKTRRTSRSPRRTTTKTR